MFLSKTFLILAIYLVIDLFCMLNDEGNHPYLATGMCVALQILYKYTLVLYSMKKLEKKFQSRKA